MGPETDKGRYSDGIIGRGMFPEVKIFACSFANILFEKLPLRVPFFDIEALPSRISIIKLSDPMANLQSPRGI
ncbi:MAG: hypothetical protein NPIRA06_25960 [Nitrospirales bacterium]|nr:MAG: hypothetical protein NPIRA06_25960 [Nitrospirales bacterium]